MEQTKLKKLQKRKKISRQNVKKCKKSRQNEKSEKISRQNGHVLVPRADKMGCFLSAKQT